jgi:hypothetical protein
LENQRRDYKNHQWRKNRV